MHIQSTWPGGVLLNFISSRKSRITPNQLSPLTMPNTNGKVAVSAYAPAGLAADTVACVTSPEGRCTVSPSSMSGAVGSVSSASTSTSIRAVRYLPTALMHRRAQFSLFRRHPWAIPRCSVIEPVRRRKANMRLQSPSTSPNRPIATCWSMIQRYDDGADPEGILRKLRALSPGPSRS